MVKQTALFLLLQPLEASQPQRKAVSWISSSHPDVNEIANISIQLPKSMDVSGWTRSQSSLTSSTGVLDLQATGACGLRVLLHPWRSRPKDLPAKTWERLPSTPAGLVTSNKAGGGFHIQPQLPTRVRPVASGLQDRPIRISLSTILVLVLVSALTRHVVQTLSLSGPMVPMLIYMWVYPPAEISPT